MPLLVFSPTTRRMGPSQKVVGDNSNNGTKEKNVVKNLRKIRDEINIEIMDMTFEQERAYLDKLLADGRKKASEVVGN